MSRENFLYDNNIMNLFARRCQWIHNKMESWEEYDDMSVLVRTTDGEDYFFDAFEEYARRVKRFEDANDLTEEEWRRGFSYFLGREIVNAGTTQNDLAKNVGININMLSRYMTCKATPSTFVTQKIADILGCDIHDILPHDFISLNHKRRD